MFLGMSFKKISDLKKYNLTLIDDISPLIGNNLAYVLKTRGITPYALAKNVGVSKQSISEIINKSINPRLDTAFKISTYLNLKVEDLFKLNNQINYLLVKDNKKPLFFDMSTFTIVDIDYRNMEIKSEREYYILSSNTFCSKEEYLTMLKNYKKDYLNKNKEEEKIYDHLIDYKFNTEICLKRFKNVGIISK